jgi:NADH-quinone oxidoreductase subunit L
MSIFDFTWLIPLIPLLMFVVILSFARRNRALSGQLAIYGAAISTALALSTLLATMVAIAEGDPISQSETPLRWFSLGTHAFPLGIYIDATSAVTLFALSLICLMTLVYSKEAMRDNPLAGRFFAIASLLIASLFGLLIFDNLLIFFILWVIMDACTYLLIGFWQEKRPAFEAGLRAFLVTGVGDLLFLLGLALLYAATGSLTYSEAFSPGLLEPPVATAVALLFFCGIVSKCAQFPLHVWLPGAAEAPAPASALIHTAATTAGALLLIRAFPLLEATAGSPLIANLDMATIVMLVGTFTVIFATFVSVTQRDIRYALSFSIIGQTGYVIVALGMGAYAAGIFHLITGIFFNTLLLLAAGSVTRGMAHGQRENPSDGEIDLYDMLNMGGMGGQQPATFWTFFIGAMALAGLVFTSGFFSRDAILTQAWANDQAVCWLLALAIGVTAFGAMRQVCLIFFGPPRTQAAGHASESDSSMIVPLVVLALFALALGLIGFPEQFQVLPNWLATFIGKGTTVTDFAPEPLLLGITFSTGGLVLGFLLYAWNPLEAGDADRLELAMRMVWLDWLYRWMRDRFYIEKAYHWIFARGSILLAGALNRLDGALDRLVNGAAWLGRGPSQLSDWFDVHVLDGLVNLVADAGKLAAQAGDRLDARLDTLVNLTGRAGEQLARASGVFDLWVAGLIDLLRPGTLALVRLSTVMDRGLDLIVGGVGNGVRQSGLWFRPKTGKVQDHLQRAAAAVVVLIVIFFLLFL